MTTKPVVLEKTSARDRLLAAAGELFYEEGINTVGIDRVIDRAGVAKASLYNVFGSKDELIRAYLAGRQEARRARVTQLLTTLATPREKILAVIDDIRESAEKPGFRGCAFVRANAELRGEHCVKNVCDDSRDWLRGLFLDLAREAGATDPETLARQLVLLYDGAAVSGQMDGKGGGAQAAREMAICLLQASGVPSPAA